MASSIFLLLSILILMVISVFTYVISKKTNFPYTLLLVLVGTGLVFVSKIPLFHFLQDFSLTPELLFYVFLPTLLFEAAYNIKIQKLVENFRSITLLAIGGLLISTTVIGFGFSFLLSLFGVEIPLIISFLFGAIISATDPVAVISLFKEYGAPKRLTLIFEGESLFNDGTAVALFTILLSVVANQGGILDGASVLEGIFMFFTMMATGALFGIFMGMVFSKALDYAKSEHLQITLTLAVAHLTFLLSEIISHYVSFFGYKLHVSAIVATVFAAIVMGNYGRHKLSSRVEKYMNNFWEYFAFLANSFVFLLLGFLISKINFVIADVWLPILVLIIVGVPARALGVYLSL
jgi:CPA1 family monovalent cation:H+ antiporter